MFLQYMNMNTSDLQNGTGMMNNISSIIPPLNSVSPYAPLIGVDWQAEELERRHKEVTCFLFFCHLIVVLAFLCWLLCVRSLRHSGCLSARQVDRLIEQGMRSLPVLNGKEDTESEKSPEIPMQTVKRSMLEMDSEDQKTGNVPSMSERPPTPLIGAVPKLKRNERVWRRADMMMMMN